jgi:protein-L-isoaspartate(D-aspartate) O-methyltransferase
MKLPPRLLLAAAAPIAFSGTHDTFSSFVALLLPDTMQLAFLLLIPNILMFMRTQGGSQRGLVDHLVRSGVVTSPEVRKVLSKVDRKNYAADWDDASAYTDTPLPIGCGQTISAPHMHGHALEDMLPYLKNSQAPSVNILDVGCGSGYLTAALGRLVDASEGEPILGKPGKVYGIDVYPELVDMTRENIQKEDGDLLTNKVVEISIGDGWKGLPDKGPFDAIHVGAAAYEFPTDLMMQLRVGGVLVIPVGRLSQALYKVERLAESPKYHNADFRKKRLLDVRYVPLVHVKDL